MSRRRLSDLFIILGVIAICGGIGFLSYNIWDMERAGEESILAAAEISDLLPEPAEVGETALPEVPDHIIDPTREMPIVESGGVGYIGILRIEELGLELPIAAECSDALLRLAPCRYYGTAYEGGMVIAGHNYRTHFGRLSRLSQGSRITFTDADGNVFEYEVMDIEQLRADQVTEMKESGWELSLFTCTFDRRDRITVRARLV